MNTRFSRNLSYCTVSLWSILLAQHQCFFKSASPSLKAYLMRQYCSDLYGCVLWNLSHNTVYKMYVWLGVRESDECGISLIKHVHMATSSNLRFFLPLSDQLMCRYGTYMMKSLRSANKIVRLILCRGMLLFIE